MASSSGLLFDWVTDRLQQLIRMLNHMLDLIDALGKVETVSDPFIQGDTEFAELADRFAAVLVENLFSGDLTNGS